MKEEQINAAISEALGRDPYGDISDYCRDLNAMHEAEKVLLADADTGYAYDMNLCDVVGAYPLASRSSGQVGFGPCNHMALFHASAVQRAEAFLRSVGKWEPVQVP